MALNKSKISMDEKVVFLRTMPQLPNRSFNFLEIADKRLAIKYTIVAINALRSMIATISLPVSDVFGSENTRPVKNTKTEQDSDIASIMCKLGPSSTKGFANK